MDFQFIETLLELPEFRVIGHVIRPRELDLHLERRDSYLVCPRCQGGCSRIKEGRERCLRDLPMLDRPVTLRLHLRRFDCTDCHHRPWEKKCHLRCPCQVDGATLPSSAPGISAWLPVPRTRASLRSVGPYRISLDVWGIPVTLDTLYP
jgi:Zn finger protein HypA/HybF involved in hydrogenase expression